MTRKWEETEKKSFHLIPFLTLLFLTLCILGAGLMLWVKKGVQNKQTTAFRKENEGAAGKVRSEIEKRYSVLTTINRIGVDYPLERAASENVIGKLKEVHHILDLGLVTENGVFLGMDGTIYPVTDERKDSYFGLSQEFLERTKNGERVSMRSMVGVPGIVIGQPTVLADGTEGILCAKFSLDELQQDVNGEVTDAAVLVTDVKGNVIFSNGRESEYLGAYYFGDFVSDFLKLRKASDFRSAVSEEGAVVNRMKNGNGGSIFASVAAVEGYPDYYVFRLERMPSFREDITVSMLIIMLVFEVVMAALILIAFYAIVMYIKNRKALYRAAYVDPLTGLPSKTKHKLDAQVLIDENNRKYAYVVFDIDHFKYINEVFGYENGNRLLVRIAEILKQKCNSNELICRVAGDNFAMLLERTGSTEDLTARVLNMFDAIVNSGNNEFRTYHLKFSCGVYLVDEALDINKVRANANLAREESKKQVFGGIVYYNEVMKTKNVEERELEYEAAEALKNGDFIVYLQPKYDVKTEKITGAEALIRWKHNTKGMLSPGKFIPLFEANGFIAELDMFVLNKVCEKIAEWLKNGIEPVCISVNLSRTHLYTEHLCDKLLETVNRYRIPSKYIEFELTESAIYEDMGTLLGIMQELKNSGFRLSMDDFGSGYSSLNLLRRLPVDVLKLDKEFLEPGENDKQAGRERRIVSHVISMAKDLEMEVLAEGVETREQRDFLKNAECDIIQGFYYAKPMPTEEFEALFREK